MVGWLVMETDKISLVIKFSQEKTNFLWFEQHEVSLFWLPRWKKLRNWFYKEEIIKKVEASFKNHYHQQT